ncbi:MAG: (d)CMP kinase [Erysipelotrichaceae bacterium]|nr:(d)CMP kinase [Erysipelotrichaceae bacterium]
MISVAIDGPSSAGKSTVAKGVAKQLGFVYVDTGAMYRCVTLYALEHNVDCQNDEEVCKLLPFIDIELCIGGKVLLNGKDVTHDIRTQPVVDNVSYIAANKGVRLFLVDIQRDMAKDVSIVMDGRDIGTYVLPNANVKIFQVADVKERAKRRYLENIEKGIECTLEAVEKDLERRDYIDSHREFAPLCKASDAIEVDTSYLTIEESIDTIVKIIKEKVGI